ncbi:glycosyltransferase family 2 protein [Microbacterium sp. YY-03]|uniref:glycosyltransferase family 2 protein n=1 Tax=Microbacterium sp. YY-03 TaxID=3421636 RepID=UPI003D17986B
MTGSEHLDRKTPARSGGSNHAVVSVIVACFNIEQYVESCLISLAKQTYPHLEVILVDDGSTDGTASLLREYARDRSGWRVITKPNGGLSSARNAGIDASSGDWLVFVDGDDMLVPHAINRLVEVAGTESAELVCGSHFIRSGGRNIPVNAVDGGVRELTQQEAFFSALYHGAIDVSAWGKLYSRRIFNSIRYPEGRIYEDTYVFGDVLAQVDKVTYVGEPLYLYVMREGSIVNAGWAGKQIQFIEAADRFAAQAESSYPNLVRAANRRRVHARLSVLRYMEKVTGKDRLLRDEIVGFVRSAGPSTLEDPQAPRRDKVGIRLVRLSPRLFFLFWKLYAFVRSDR